MLPCVGMAQPTSIESLTIEQGLSQGMIYDILQARDGFPIMDNSKPAALIFTALMSWLL